ncbi:MAG: peptidase S16 [Spirochaetaceae bacterium]|nr:MAG: peptidase S16 [Spirochaetaceae bacterium]
MSHETLPIFPLGLVLLPGLPLPLHIFEERYRDMVARCLDENVEFGVLLYDGAKLRSHGCLARIERILKTYDDGRLDIVTVGTDRFRVQEMDNSGPYMQAQVERFTDEDSDDVSIGDLRNDAIQRLQAFVDLGERSIDMQTLESLDATALSFLIAGTDAFEAHEKQRLLEITSTGERLRRCVEALEGTLERLELNRRIKKIIGTNGHIPDAFGPEP